MKNNELIFYEQKKMFNIKNLNLLKTKRGKLFLAKQNPNYIKINTDITWLSLRIVFVIQWFNVDFRFKKVTQYCLSKVWSCFPYQLFVCFTFLLFLFLYIFSLMCVQNYVLTD